MSETTIVLTSQQRVTANAHVFHRTKCSLPAMRLGLMLVRILSEQKCSCSCKRNPMFQIQTKIQKVNIKVRHQHQKRW